MEATQTTMTLQDVKDFLLRIQAGHFEDDEYLAQWFTPPVAQFFLEHVQEIIPRDIRYVSGEPLQCHTNALRYAAEHPGVSPMFGFQLFDRVFDGWGKRWWYLHSFILDGDTIIDSGEELLTVPRFFACEWSWVSASPYRFSSFQSEA